VYGSYVEQRFNDTARTAICTTQVGGTSGYTGGNVGQCNPNWSSWNVGTRSQWNITKDLYVGLDVIYLKLNSSTNATGVLPGTVGGGGKPTTAGAYTVSDQDTWAATWRIHRDIVP
jgi:hypothetical protein